MIKKIHILILLIPLILISCKSVQEHESYSTENLTILPVTENTYIHISYLETNDFGKVPCNGVVYLNEDEAIVIDTPTTENASKELINWVEKERGKNIKAVIATHFHEDCLGGLQQFHNNGTKSYANTSTIDILKTNNKEILPEYGFENKMEIKIGKQSVYAEFFGEGHTTDNIIGYIPSENILFGGCLIKAVDASKGYLGDANTAEWSKTVAKIRIAYPGLRTIVPGHGEHGGTELLDYTEELFAQD